MEGFDAGEHPGPGAGGTLFGHGQVVEFAAAVGLAFGGLVFFKDANALADGLSGVLVVAGDHDDTDASFTAQSDGGFDLKYEEKMSKKTRQIEGRSALLSNM